MPVDHTLKIDKAIGDVAVKAGDGSGFHLFKPPDLPFFDDGRQIRKLILAAVEKQLGPHRKLPKESRQDEVGYGIYTIERVSYVSDSYRLEVTDDETYVGASAGTEQIILAIAAGGAGGVAGELARRFFNWIAQVEGSDGQVLDDDVKLNRVSNLLRKHYAASGEITYHHLKESDGRMHLAGVDERGRQYDVYVSEKRRMLGIEVRPA